MASNYLKTCWLQICGWCIFLIVSSLHTVGQVPFFEKQFTSPGVDICFSVCQLPDSSVYLFGYAENGTQGSYDMALTKVTARGDFCWTRYYGTTQLDVGTFMNVADGNNLILLGVTQSTVTSQGEDILLVKVDSSGNEIWRRVIGGPGNENCRYVEQTADGGYIFCGYCPDSNSSSDSWIVKTDASGNPQWANNFGGPSNDVAARVVATSANSWAVTCDTKILGNGSYDIQVIGLDSVGDQTFSHIHGDSLTNGCQGMFFSSARRLVSFGETETHPNSWFDFLIHVFDEYGNFIREQSFGGIGAEAMFDMTEAPNGDWLGVGYTNSSSGGLLPINLAVSRMDSVGNVLWMHEFGGSGIDLGYRIIPALGGGYYVAGRTTQQDEDFYLLHIDENGVAGFEKYFNLKSGIVRLTPNPATDFLTIELQNGIEQLFIFRSDGALVREVGLGPTETKKVLNIRDLSAGVYLLKAVSSTGISTTRFVRTY